MPVSVGALRMVWTHYNLLDGDWNSETFLLKTEARLVQSVFLVTPWICLTVISHQTLMMGFQSFGQNKTDSVLTFSRCLNLDRTDPPLVFPQSLGWRICCESVFLYCTLKMILLLRRRQSMPALLKSSLWRIFSICATDWSIFIQSH